MHTFNSLKNDLHSMGLNGTETVIVHSSMKSIGEVDGKADTVLNSLCSFFKDGLLVLPSFSYTAVNICNSCKYYEKTTPSCVGLLPELFRLRPDVYRSLHPNHSLAACGKDAKDFVSGHEKGLTSFDKSGPFGKLLERNAKALLIGVTLNRATIIHAIIEWSDVAILSKEDLHFISIDRNGVEYPVRMHYHLGSQWDNFNRALDILLEQNAVRKVKFGDADSLLMDCCQTFDILEKILRDDPKFFYNPDCVASIQYPGLKFSDLK